MSSASDATVPHNLCCFDCGQPSSFFGVVPEQKTVYSDASEHVMMDWSKAINIEIKFLADAVVEFHQEVSVCVCMYVV
jgi:hypothetical protein